ncbi:hypothetical protein [Pedobacter deserti]|uniref:hypothetical protein n=1 Tax=Pedobacter deserti TaxID=2817382 RepID=UPI00210C76A5|nr:hypothetical protein [Pedobacter sp. SYSU D00382]
MRTPIFGFVFLVLQGCSSDFGDSFTSQALTSSKGEVIYVNTLNWGVTDDHQLSAVSTDLNKLSERTDTAGTIEGLEPFIYSFKNDSLTLYFDREVAYNVGERFKTIRVSYVSLDGEEFRGLRAKAYKNDDYYCVPKRRPSAMSSDMPMPSSN